MELVLILPLVTASRAPFNGRVYHFHRRFLFVDNNKRVIRVTTSTARKALRKERGEHSIKEKWSEAW
jgi:hypothetical protein